jgi:hypothetical protein
MMMIMLASLVAVLAHGTEAEDPFDRIPFEVLPERARHGALGRSGRFETPAEYTSSSSYTLSVPLDYDEPNGARFNIHYFVDDKYWDAASGPIFVSMGGEGGTGGAYCSSECQQHRALAVSVEHRFFGRSAPGKGGVETSTYKKGLRVEWNLRDTAAVIDHVQSAYVKGKPRIAMNFGGSYSGGTCSWFRQLFPNKTAGCVSSSGVVDAKLNMWEFDDQIAKAYSIPDGKACPDALHAVMEALERSFAAGGGDDMKRQFAASNLIGTPQGDNDFWYGVADGAAMIDQYGGKATLCKAFRSLPSNPSDDARIQNLKQTLDHHYGKGFVGGGFYDSECVKTPNPPSHCASGVLGGINDRSWRFLKCSELGYLQPAPPNQTAMRSSHLTIQALLDQCDYCFGDGQAAALKENNAAFQTKFGGSEPASGTLGASNIMFLDYSDDPWQRASVTRETDPSLPFCLTTCDGCGHCGSGVPSRLHHCSDVRSQFVTQILSGAANNASKPVVV